MSFEHEEITKRTQLAIAAEQEAYKAQMGVLGLKRTVRWLRWFVIAGSTALTLIGCGYAIRHRMEEIPTKQDVEQLKVDRDEARTDRKLMWQQIQSMCSSQSRIEGTVEKFDQKLTNILMLERRRQ